MQTDMLGNKIKDVTMWDRLTEEKKQEIIKKSREKKKANLEDLIRKNRDIESGVQRSIISAWED